MWCCIYSWGEIHLIFLSTVRLKAQERPYISNGDTNCVTLQEDVGQHRAGTVVVVLIYFVFGWPRSFFCSNSLSVPHPWTDDYNRGLQQIKAYIKYLNRMLEDLLSWKSTHSNPPLKWRMITSVLLWEIQCSRNNKTPTKPFFKPQPRV